MLDEAAKRSNIVRHTKCWIKMFELHQTFPSNILRHKQCLPFSHLIQHDVGLKMFDRLAGALETLERALLATWKNPRVVWVVVGL